jgi:hypothetical protein
MAGVATKSRLPSARLWSFVRSSERRLQAARSAAPAGRKSVELLASLHVTGAAANMLLKVNPRHVLAQLSESQPG